MAEEPENDSIPIVKEPILRRYNKPSRRQALLSIRHMIVEEGLSHQEIQLRLNIPPATYFRYLDMLFETEQEVIAGNNYTYQRLLNETLILYQRFLRRARRLEKMADDPSLDAEIRLQAEVEAGEFERACHDMTYHAPSYLAVQGLLPGPKKHDACLSMTRISFSKDRPEKKDPSEYKRLTVAGAMRLANQTAKELNEREKNPNNSNNNLLDKLQKKLQQPQPQPPQ